MLAKLRPRLTYANVTATIALFVALSTGGAYAANTIGSSDVIDESLLSQDFKNGEVRSPDIGTQVVIRPKISNGAVDANKLADGAVTSAKVLDDNQPGGGLNPQDLAVDSVRASEVASNSIDSDEVVDFGLTNQDVGVLFAEVNTVGTLFDSSGGVTVTKLAGDGNYVVDFGRDITACTALATIGSPTTFMGNGGEVKVADRSNNVEAVLVSTTTSAGVGADRSFHLAVVC